MEERDRIKLLELYPEYTSILGPYTRKDGRKHLVLNNNNLPSKDKNKRKTLSYPKALMENHIKRRLFDDETVDHIDGNFTNDDMNNLQILDRRENALKSSPKLIVKGVCVNCSKIFILSKEQRSSRAKWRKGPFCTRSCSGRYLKGV